MSFLSLNPKRSCAVAEIDRCIDKQYMRGLKLHFWNSMVDTRNEQHRTQLGEVLPHTAARGLSVLAHIFVQRESRRDVLRLGTFTVQGHGHIRTES